ncbi:MAG: winged helix-turn-helix transcriptional regulator [Candidatus Helarchaeota archaeon]|nr:winged helix-turn-helix transcriptional regulator [Candidatus Helarchaeota archaeon]
MKGTVWNPTPLKNLILYALVRNKGVILDSELLRLLQKDYSDLSQSKLSQTLMQLEVPGIIHTSRITKSKNRIELTRTGRELFKNMIK